MNPIKAFLKVILLKPLYNLLVFFVWLAPGDSLGVAVIALTIIVRLVLLPPSLKAARLQKKMQDLAPELVKIKEVHKDDKKAQAQATFDLHKTHGINPANSCLLSLIQIPVVIILYYVFQIGLNTNRFDLLYPFVPRPETINTMFFGIDLAQPDKLVFPILIALSQFAFSWIMPKMSMGNDETTSKLFQWQFKYVFPLFFAYISIKLPAALPLYWVVSNIFGIAQQVYVNKTGAAPVLVSSSASVAKPAVLAAPEPVSSAPSGSGPRESVSTTSKKGVTITVRKKSR